jgi:hypothetical protein
MANKPCLLQVTFANVTALPEDNIVNTWHVLADDATAGGLAAALGIAATRLIDFYTAGAGTADKVSSYFTNKISNTADAHHIKAYDLTTPSPRVPIIDATFSRVAAASATRVPDEVALCLSYQADKVAGTPQSRRRGRIYLGPLNGQAQNAGDGTLPATAFMNAVAARAAALAGASDTDAEWTWVVHSAKYGTDATVTNGWVDNAFDTQRRRGQRATARTTWT